MESSRILSPRSSGIGKWIQLESPGSSPSRQVSPVPQRQWSPFASEQVPLDPHRARVDRSSQATDDSRVRQTSAGRNTDSFMSRLSQVAARLSEVQQYVVKKDRIAKHATELRLRRRLKLNNEDDVVSPCRVAASLLLYSQRTEQIIGSVTVVNFILLMVDADINASNETTPLAMVILNNICLLMYTVEFVFRLYVERFEVLKDPLGWLDGTVCVTGFMSAFFEIADFATAGAWNPGTVFPLGPLRTLRCIRLLRLVKAIVLVNHQKHLRRLIQGIASCMKTLFWALFLVFVFLSTWAILAVELLHPLMGDVADNMRQKAMDGGVSAWANCARCEYAFSSVMHANLTFMQTIIGGDSWGEIAVPVMEQQPLTAVIFVGSLFTINVGLLNLVVAVLVDTATEARLKDTEARHAEALQDEREEKKNLAEIFRMVDADGGGTLSYEELAEGADSVEEFKKQLRVMDIQGSDLQQLFTMLDEDGSGEIDPDEFIETLYRLKCGDNQTAATFVKHYVVHLRKTQTEMIERLKSMETALSSCALNDGTSSAQSKFSRDRHVKSKLAKTTNDAALREGTTMTGISSFFPVNTREDSAGTSSSKSAAVASNPLAALVGKGSEDALSPSKITLLPTHPGDFTTVPEPPRQFSVVPEPARQTSLGTTEAPQRVSTAAEHDRQISEMPEAPRKSLQTPTYHDLFVDSKTQGTADSSNHEPRVSQQGSAYQIDLPMKGKGWMHPGDCAQPDVRHFDLPSPVMEALPEPCNFGVANGCANSDKFADSLTQEQIVDMMAQLVLCPLRQESADLSFELRRRIESQIKDAERSSTHLSQRLRALQEDMDYSISEGLRNALSPFQSFVRPSGGKDVVGLNALQDDGAFDAKGVFDVPPNGTGVGGGMLGSSPLVHCSSFDPDEALVKIPSSTPTRLLRGRDDAWEKPW